MVHTASRLFTAILLIIFTYSASGQGANCLGADPFCTGTTYNFPNTTNNGDLGPISCLGSSPNPAWYYMEIDQNGPMDITINQTSAAGSGLDVDFILWGPFTSLSAACATNLLANSGVDCSYSASATEVANIPNAQVGEVYVLLLTNYSNQPGNISFSQTGGTGSADCSLLCGITSFTANPSACNPATNTYSVSGQLAINNPPVTGTLTISNSCGGSQVFNMPNPGPFNYNFTGITANGGGCVVSCTWSADPTCNSTVNYTAPTPCNPSCNITSLTAVPGAPSCPAATYSATGQIQFVNPPASGTLTVSGSCGGSQIFNAPFVSPLNYTLNGLPANGSGCTVTAVFSATPACTQTANMTAPACSFTVDAGPNGSVCPGDCITLTGTATGANSVYWSPGATLDDSTILNPLACPTVTTTYTLTGTVLGPNTIVNGNFSAGNTGFSSSYTYTPPPNTNQGQYYVGTNASLWNGGLSATGDHTSGTGNFLQVNGATTANVSVWCQTVPVTANTDYEFSAWITSLYGVNFPILQFSINGVLVGGTFTPPGPVGTWSQFFTTWNSGINTTANICIVNQNTLASGNDFGIDDISFSPIVTSTDVVTVTVNGQQDASISPAGPFCANNPPAFLTAVDPGGTWSGPGITNGATGQFSPSVAGPGTHTIQYLIPGSCGDTSTVQIQVIPNDDATITSAGPFCILDAPVNLTGADPGGTWSGTGITNVSAGTFNPSVAGAGSHVITYTISGACGDSQNTTIIVNGQTPATINPAGPFCVNAGSVNLSAVNPGGTWSGPGITNTATGTFSPAAAGAGTHTITYMTAGNCGDTSTIQVTVNPLPVIAFTGDTLSGCSPLCVDFTDNSTVTGGTITSWNWNFGDGATSTLQNPSHCYNNTTFNTQNFNVSLTATSAGGCSASQTINNMVTVFAIPEADFTFGPQPTTILYPSIAFTNLSLGATIFSWDFDGLGGSNIANPVFEFPDDSSGTYLVCLTATNANGCVNVNCHTVVISDQFLLYVPNSFTPDGNGINDIFVPIITGYDATRFEMMIFNRWGELIYATDDASRGWDGTHKGVKAKEDVYVWKIKAKDVSSGEKKEFYGHVNLLR